MFYCLFVRVVLNDVVFLKIIGTVFIVVLIGVKLI